MKLEEHGVAADNLRRLLGEKRWEQLVSPPFKLWIPSKLWQGCYWCIRASNRVRFYNPANPCQYTDDGAIPICRGPAYGFLGGVPVADRILAKLLWIITDELAFFEGKFPRVGGKGKGRLAAWDAIFEGGG